MNQKDLILCLKIAKTVSMQSTAVRLQVGCVIYDKRSRNIVSIGYNGMPAGDSNICEEHGITKKEVIHAEVNALNKLSWVMKLLNKKHYALCVTHAPCVGCAKKILGSGIREVFYLYPYGDGKGVGMLMAAGVLVKRVLWDGI